MTKEELKFEEHRIKMKKALNEKYGYVIDLNFSQSGFKYFMQFMTKSGIHIATMIDGGNNIVIYKLDEEVKINA